MKTSVKLSLFLAIFFAHGFTAHAQTLYVSQWLGGAVAQSIDDFRQTFEVPDDVDLSRVDMRIFGANGGGGAQVSLVVNGATRYDSTVETIVDGFNNYPQFEFSPPVTVAAGDTVALESTLSSANGLNVRIIGEQSNAYPDGACSVLGGSPCNNGVLDTRFRVYGTSTTPASNDVVYFGFEFDNEPTSPQYTFNGIQLSNELSHDFFTVPDDSGETIGGIWGVCREPDPFIISNQAAIDRGINPNLQQVQDNIGEKGLYCFDGNTVDGGVQGNGVPQSVASSGYDDGYYIIWDTGAYYFFNKNGAAHTTFDPFSVEYQTRNSFEQQYVSDKVVQVIQPTYATTTATTSVYFSVNFQQLPTFDLLDNFTTRYEVRSATNNELVYGWERDWVPQSLNFTQQEFVQLDEGSYIVTAFFQNDENSIISETDDVFFNVITNTYEQQTGLPFPAANAGDLSQNDCTTFDVGCQFQRAIVFLFYPSDTVLNRFQSVWQTLRDIPPFGYVTATLESLERLDNTATAAFSFGNIPFMSTIFTPMHGLISSILWALFAIWFFLHRLRHLEI